MSNFDESFFALSAKNTWNCK